MVSRDSTVDGDWLRAGDWCTRYRDTEISKKFGDRLRPEPDQILVPSGGANSSCDFQIGVCV